MAVEAVSRMSASSNAARRGAETRQARLESGRDEARPLTDCQDCKPVGDRAAEKAAIIAVQRVLAQESGSTTWLADDRILQQDAAEE